MTDQNRMETVRAPHEEAMTLAFKYVNPRRVDMTGTLVAGTRRKTQQYDGVGQDAFLTWRDGIIGWFVGPSVTTVGPGWHKASLGHIPGVEFARMVALRRDDNVKAYLQDYDEQMRYEVRNSNFYQTEGEWLQDLGSGGTAAVIPQESLDLTRTVFRVPHPSRYWLAENADYEVDVYHEKLTLTAHQAIQRYNKPDDRLPPLIKNWASDAASANLEVTFLQCVRSSTDPILGGRIAWSPYALVTLVLEMHGGSGMPVPDNQFQSEADRLVRVEPLDRFSPIVTRMRRNSDEIYGYSQAMDVLTVIELVQKHGKNLIHMGNLAADPVKFVPTEARRQWSFLPGATNTYADVKRIAYTMPMGGEYPIAIDRENKLHQLIYARYGYNLWQMMPMYQQKKERNQAYEIQAAEAQQARLLVSQTANLWDDGFVPMYDAIAANADARGSMPDPPAILQDAAGKDVINIDPIGPLTQLQEWSATVSPLQQGMQFLGSIAEVTGRHVGPAVAAQLYHRINLPDLAEFALDKTGFPRRLMRTDDEVADRIARDEQQAAAQQQAQIAREMAAASAQMGKPVDESSLLAGAVQ